MQTKLNVDKEKAHDSNPDLIRNYNKINPYQKIEQGCVFIDLENNNVYKPFFFENYAYLMDMQNNIFCNNDAAYADVSNHTYIQVINKLEKKKINVTAITPDIIKNFNIEIELK